MDASVRTSMQIIAHELTHSFFALLTFHKVKHIRVADDNSGGSMGFEGEGNWLIIIAPYFFPLFCFSLRSAWVLYETGAVKLGGQCGLRLFYRLSCRYGGGRKSMKNKPTCRKSSYLFCALFLPGCQFVDHRQYDGV